MRSVSRTTDVLVIGAGPTGLTLANALSAQGLQTTVIDRQTAGANTSRAAVVHAHTLEVLENIDVARRLVARGVKCKTFNIQDRDRILIAVDFTKLPTPYPYTLMLSQADTEAVLLERLHELGGEVMRPYELIGMNQDSDFAYATLEDGRRFRARYLIGADGMHSKVREFAGIEFAGAPYAESFVLADVRFVEPPPREQVVLYFSPAGMMVLAPLPDGIFRIVGPVETAPGQPSVEFVQNLLDTRGPAASRAVVREIVWGSHFRVHHRVAETYRRGRVLLAGDAAHVHSPAGGQGMNTGIQDAIALADALADAYAGFGEAALDAYGATRRPVATEVVAQTDRLTRLATADRWWRTPRNALLWALGHAPAFRRQLAWQLSGLAYR